MAKKSGLGAQLFVDGYDISGDVGEVNRMAKPSGILNCTGIDKSGFERMYSHVDGEISFKSFFNDGSDQQLTALKAKGAGADRGVMFLLGSAIGNMAAAMTAKQVNFDPTRGQDGSLTIDTQCLANAYGLDYGEQLTAGKRTDGSATNGSSLDAGAATANGLVAYLQVFAFTGTSVTVKIQQSSDNGSGDAFADLITFTAATGRTFQRLSTVSLTTAVERYLRVVTTGTFSNAVFAVSASRYADAI